MYIHCNTPQRRLYGMRRIEPVERESFRIAYRWWREKEAEKYVTVLFLFRPMFKCRCTARLFSFQYTHRSNNRRYLPPVLISFPFLPCIWILNFLYVVVLWLSILSQKEGEELWLYRSFDYLSDHADRKWEKAFHSEANSLPSLSKILSIRRRFLLIILFQFSFEPCKKAAASIHGVSRLLWKKRRTI